MQINLNSIKAIINKELKNYLNSVSYYIVLIVFLVLWYFIFFQSVFIMGEANLRGLFEYFPWLSLILIPSLTMGSFSKEKDDGTLEFLLTHPLREVELILGKFISAMIFVLITLLFTLPLALSFSGYSNFDWGMYAGQCIGVILLSTSYVALGLFISSIFSTQIASLLVTIGVGFLFMIIGSELFTMALPLEIVPFLERISLSSHFQPVIRGAIDIRDIWYYLSFLLIFIGLTYLQLLKNKYGNRREKYSQYVLGIFIFTIIMVVSNVLGDRIPGRFDLTKNKVYTLSEATVKTITGLNDIVRITVYSSDQLPAAYLSVLRETKDMLRDYQSLSKGKIVVEYKNPSKDPLIRDEALMSGIQEIQFNVIGQEDFQVKTGFLGMKITYAINEDVVPFVNQTNGLEYLLTSGIRKVSVVDKKVIGVLNGIGDNDFFVNYRTFNDELSRQFEIKSIDITPENPMIDTTVDALIIAAPTSEFALETLNSIDLFIQSGKSVLYLVDPVIVDIRTGLVTPNPSNILTSLNSYGVFLNTDLVYDLDRNQTIRTGAGPTGYNIAYPFWLRTINVDSEFPIVSGIDSFMLPWASSISIDEGVINDRGIQLTKLLKTSKSAGTMINDYDINPAQEFSRDNLKERLLAVALEMATPEQGATSAGRVVVISDSDVFAEDWLSNSGENIALGINAVSWLIDEDSIATVKVRQSASEYFNFTDANQPTTLRIINFVLIIAVPILIFIVFMIKRKQLRSQKYE